jgi:hypothetical protein
MKPSSRVRWNPTSCALVSMSQAQYHAPRVAGVEPVARGARVGEGRVDVALPVEGQVLRPAREGQFPPVQLGTAFTLRDQPGTGLALDLGKDGGLRVAVHQPPQDRGFVVGLGDQPQNGAVIDEGDPQTPPRSASDIDHGRAGSWATRPRSSHPRAAHRRTQDPGSAVSPTPVKSARRSRVRATSRGRSARSNEASGPA